MPTRTKTKKKVASRKIATKAKKPVAKAKEKSVHAVLAEPPTLKARFVPDYVKLKKMVDDLRRKGKKVVLTQGVYDLIHEGHAAYLERARDLGDVLIVGVDSDELTKLRKGPRRPIVPQKERLSMLLHLRHVDFVTLKEVHHNLEDLIIAIRPDVMVFSNSTKEITPEVAKYYKQYCGKVIVLPPQATTTTSSRVRNLTIEGVENLAEEIEKLITEFLEKIRNA